MGVLCLLVSCKKEGVPENQPTTQEATFSFMFDGKMIGGTSDNTVPYFPATGVLELYGSSDLKSVSADHYFILHLLTPNGEIKTGQYAADGSTDVTGNSGAKYEQLTGIVNGTSQYKKYTTSSSCKLNITVISYNKTTKYIECTFSGSLEDYTNKSVHIVSNGVFKSTIK